MNIYIILNFQALTKQKKNFPLVIANKRFSPVLIYEPGLGKHVIGEVYAINQDTLYKIDALERTNMNKGYFRKEIQVIDLNHNKSILCYTYFKQRENLKVIHSEYLESYSDTRYKKKQT